MADILIKGMEMPKDTGSITVTIYSDGSTGIWTEQEMVPGGMAIEVPPHGRLIDENNLVPLIEENYGCGVCKNKSDEERCLDRCKWAVLLNDIDSIPTTLEASDNICPTDADEHSDEMQSDMRDYCERYEPTYNPEDGSM